VFCPLQATCLLLSRRDSLYNPNNIWRWSRLGSTPTAPPALWLFTQALPALRRSYVPDIQAQVGFCAWRNSNSNTLGSDRSQHHRTSLSRLCYHPAVFFRHHPLTAFSFSIEKFCARFKNVVISIFSTFQACSQNYEKRLLSSLCLSVRASTENKSVPTRPIFIKSDTCVFFENLSRKLKFNYNIRRGRGRYFTRRPTYIYDNVQLNFSHYDKCLRQSCRENQNTHFMFSNFCSENPAVYGVTWRNVAEWTGRRWQYYMAHALCVLDNWGYRHTLRTHNTSCFCMGKIVTRTRLEVSFTHTLPHLLKTAYVWKYVSRKISVKCLEFRKLPVQI
jgi:hypothetical protein